MRFSISRISLAFALLFLASCSSSSTTQYNIPFFTIPLSPASLTFFGTGAAFAQTFSASDPGYTGIITLTSTCSTLPVVSFSATSATGPNLSVTVTPLNAGNCVVTVHDNTGAQASANITVTTGSVGVGGRKQ
jgi:hypothetical protein